MSSSTPTSFIPADSASAVSDDAETVQQESECSPEVEEVKEVEPRPQQHSQQRNKRKREEDVRGWDEDEDEEDDEEEAEQNESHEAEVSYSSHQQPQDEYRHVNKKRKVPLTFRDVFLIVLHKAEHGDLSSANELDLFGMELGDEFDDEKLERAYERFQEQSRYLAAIQGHQNAAMFELGLGY